MSLTDLTLTALGAELRARRTSSREIVDAFLDRIRRADGKLHAFVEVYETEARALADAADRARAAGLPAGPLHGLPIGLKDLFDIEGRIGTGGSKMWTGRVATETAATAERLLAAGMIPLGKQHMVEFAFGAWGLNPLMGTPWNPWDLNTHRIPGGSSSGTGVAVAARLAPAGIGSDTGGSIRIPSAFNGLVGLKPTCGRVSLHGTLLLSWTLDSIGPLARSVSDCALLLSALAGPDPRDPTTLGQPVEEFTQATRDGVIRGRRIALPDAGQLPDVTHPAVQEAWQRAAQTLAELGATVEPVRLPDGFFDLRVLTGTIIASEAFALHRNWIDDESRPIGPAVRQRVLDVRTLAPGAYAVARHELRLRRQAFAEWFRPYHALLLPTVPIPAPPVPEADEASPIPGVMTRPVNFLGLCSLALPSGFADRLPLSVQLVGKPFAESTILALGRAFEDATGFTRRAPDLTVLGL